MTRRRFVGTSSGLVTAGLSTLAARSVGATEAAAATSNASTPIVRPGDVVLFQGDSITSSSRREEQQGRANTQPALGSGFVWLAVSQFLIDHPENPPQFYNRAVSGAFVAEMAERWQQDCLDLKPDVVSILVGVNDYWHRYLREYDGRHEQYVNDYRAILKRTCDALPNARIIIGEPFMYPCGEVTQEWFPGFVPHRAATRQLAVEAGAVFIPNQSLIDAACKLAPPEQWSRDGCHPTADGAALLAHWWLNAVEA